MQDLLHSTGSGSVLNTLLTHLYIKFSIDPNSVSDDDTLQGLCLSSLDQINFFMDVEDDFDEISAGTHFSNEEIFDLSGQALSEVAARVYDELENPYLYSVQ